MQQHEQFSKVVPIGTRVVRLSGHQRQPSPPESRAQQTQAPGTGLPGLGDQHATNSRLSGASSAYSEDVGDCLMLVASSKRVSALESAESRCGVPADAERSRTTDRGGMGG
jgi:hypothetical protein